MKDEWIAVDGGYLAKLMTTFKKNTIDTYGEHGVKGLTELPKRTAYFAKKYSLSELLPVPNMSFNYVAAGYQNNLPIILKIGFDRKALAKEKSCLMAFADHGAAKILAGENDMIIMQQAIPGSTLKEYFPHKEDEAIKILSSVIKNLHSAKIPNNHNFCNIKDLLKILDNNLNIPNEILIKARSFRDKLLTSADETVLLHGDLHHENILKNGNNWLVIDPKGLIGDPIFDVCAFISNPIPDLLTSHHAVDMINNRIKLCANFLGFPGTRIRQWHFVHTVLCWAWQIEDNLDPQYFKNLLNLINSMTT